MTNEQFSNYIFWVYCAVAVCFTASALIVIFSI